MLEKVTNIKSISENYGLLRTLIDPFLSELENDPLKNRQKILETCHLGKFLIFFNSELSISELSNLS